MRWNAIASSAGFNGQIAAVPVTLLSREEDVHHPLYTRQPAASRRPVPTKTPVQRRPTIASLSETIHLNSTVVNEKPPVTTSARVLTPRAEDPPTAASTDDAYAKFLVCAGRAMNAESPRSNNDAYDEIPLVEPSVHPPPEMPRSARGLQRSDSELELIIHELREKIASHHRSEGPQTDDDGLGRDNSVPSRKHLKNPLEKMSLTASSSSIAQLRRQASASQVHATRLVHEGSAAMVTPAVLSASMSRTVLNTGSTASHSHIEVKEAVPVPCPESTDAAEGFRIRAYVTGSDASTSSSLHPTFTSSTSLGQHVIPTTLSSPPRVQAVETPIHASLLRVPKPQARTLADLDLDLDRLNEVDDDDGRALSPVGPWVLDYEPLASSRSTASLTTTSSFGELALPTPDAGELSPRSRLLWLSDCCSDDGWATPSVRVLAMLRPGSTQPKSQGARPASAVQLRRRHSKSKISGTPGKTRATSAKIPKRPSGDGSATNDGGNHRTHRPRSGSGNASSSSNSSSCGAAGRVLVAQRPSFRA